MSQSCTILRNTSRLVRLSSAATTRIRRGIGRGGRRPASTPCDSVSRLRNRSERSTGLASVWLKMPSAPSACAGSEVKSIIGCCNPISRRRRPKVTPSVPGMRWSVITRSKLCPPVISASASSALAQSVTSMP